MIEYSELLVDFKSVLSLKRLSSVKLLIQVFNQSDIGLRTRRFIRSYGNYAEWETILYAVDEHVSNLPLLQSLIDEVKLLVRPVGMEILKWLIHLEYKEYCCMYGQEPINFISELHWTSLGTIDNQRTAEVFLCNATFEAEYRYRVACLCCCEGEIVTLWNQIHPDKRLLFYKGEYHMFFEHLRIFDYWTCFALNILDEFSLAIKRDSPDDSLFVYMSKWSIRRKNEMAFKYFAERLSYEEKEVVFEELATEAVGKCCADALWFLIDILGEEQKKVVYETHAYEILEIISKTWPWQNFFIATTSRFWNIITQEEFSALLFYLLKETNVDDHKCETCIKAFRDLWEQSPPFLQNQLIQDPGTFWELLSILIEADEWLSIKLILNSYADKEKQQLIYSCYGQAELLELFETGKWNLLKLFLETAFATEDEINEFKSFMMGDANQRQWFYMNEQWWYSVEDFIKWKCSSENNVRLMIVMITENWRLEYVSLIKEDLWDIASMFIKWRYPSEEETAKFKQDLLMTDTKLFCANLIVKGEWHIIERLIKWADIPLQEKVKEFKKNVVESYGSMVCHKFITAGNWASMQVFQKWCSFSIEEETDFKRRFWDKDGIRLCYDLIQIGWKRAKQFLNWYRFNTREELINFKKRVWEAEYDNLNLCTHLIVRNVESVGKFLQWCEFPDKDVAILKEEIAEKQGLEICFQLCDDLPGIEKFLNWCFSRQDERDRFKKYVLRREQGAQAICLHFLKMRQLSSAEVFVKWCGLTETELDHFKADLMLSQDTINLCRNYLLRGVVHYTPSGWQVIEDFINWCCPTEESIATYISIFENEDPNLYAHRCLEKFLSILYSYTRVDVD